MLSECFNAKVPFFKCYLGTLSSLAVLLARDGVRNLVDRVTPAYTPKGSFLGKVRPVLTKHIIF